MFVRRSFWFKLQCKPCYIEESNIPSFHRVFSISMMSLKVEHYRSKFKVATSNGHLWQVHAVPPLALAVTFVFLLHPSFSHLPLCHESHGSCVKICMETKRKQGNMFQEKWEVLFSEVPSEVITALVSRPVGKFESFVSFSRVSSILLYTDAFVIHLLQLPHPTHPEWPSPSVADVQRLVPAHLMLMPRVIKTFTSGEQ